MSKAKPYPEHAAGRGGKDEDEKTTVESPWEDEASTTIEQGEAAEKVRAAGSANNGKRAPIENHTNHTHTGTGVDEPTVDDQHSPVLSAITPIRPDTSARLIITAGNDAGQEIQIRPGKTHTVGRAIDNDVVLTDIAVSRKHFDLKFEDGAWIVVDRGSGNGTVVNGNVEDNPFMLATGDVIELGNTVIRFEMPNGVARGRGRDVEEDDEQSTVAGKIPREEEPLPQAPPARPRPKTLPPPPPPRAAPTNQPPIAPRHASPTQPPHMAQRPHSPSAQQAIPSLAQTYPPPSVAASTMPMPQMANRPPLAGASAPTMLGDNLGLPPQMQAHLSNMPVSPGVATTLPGQGMPGPSPAMRSSYPYPQAAEIPPHSVHAQMLQIQGQHHRPDGSTAHVPPSPYDPMNPMLGMSIPPQPAPSSLSKRTKLAIAGIGLALLTGIVTAAVVKSSAKKPAPSTVAKQTPTATPIAKPQPTATPISTTAKQDGPKPDVPKETPKQEAAKQEAAKQEAAKQEAAKQEAARQEAAKQEAAKADAERREAAKQEAAKADAERREAARQQAANQQAAKQEAAKAEAERREAAKQEAARQEAARQQAARDRKNRDTTTGSSNKRVATADSSAARDKADKLYEARKFNDAAAVLLAAKKSASGDEAKELERRAGLMSGLGKALAQGTAPAQKSVTAFDFLQQALNYDNNLGGKYVDEINGKLSGVAAKAAVAYAAQKDYAKARSAYLKAMQLGSTDANLSLVKQKLESYAGELYSEGMKLVNSNPSEAKATLGKIRGLVDAKSPWAVKAQAQLNKM